MAYIHESTPSDLKEILTAVTSMKDKIFKSKKNVNYLDKSSISRATKDLVASFPVLCSDTISPTTASMISKAVERNCVVMLQLLFSSAYITAFSGREALAQWHKNLDSDFGMDEYLDIVKNFQESTGCNVISDREYSEILKEFAPAIQEHITSMKEVYPLYSFSESSINCYDVTLGRTGDLDIRKLVREDWDPDASFQSYANKFVYDDHGNIVGNTGAADLFFKNKQMNQIDIDRMDRMQARAADEKRYKSNDAWSRKVDKAKMQTDQDRIGVEKDKLELDNDKFLYDVTKERRRFDRDLRRDQKEELKNQAEFFTRQLMDSDAKKFNELVPSLLIIRFAIPDVNNDRNFAIEQQCIIGVKTRLIPCDSFEIIDRVRSIEKNKISLVNLVRATTKEISFSKDFIQCVDQAKIDAKRNTRISKTSPIWRVLQNRSNKSVLNRLRRNKANDASAITTLVVSSEEINALKKDYDIDLSIPAKAKYFMEQYNLLALVIVDEEVEVARFLYDGEKFFQDYSFASLEKETGDGSYRKIVNLMSKINRG